MEQKNYPNISFVLYANVNILFTDEEGLNSTM